MRAVFLVMLLTISADSAVSAQTTQPSVTTERQSDSLLNGALIGAGVGVASELFVCTLMEPWDICRNDFNSMAKFGAIGAGVGIAIDALIRKKIYRTAGAEVQAAPLMGRRGTGIHVSVRF